MIIPVNISNEPYDIVLERGVLTTAAEHLRLERKTLIVTDSGVPEFYARNIQAQCKSAYVHTIPQGESSKAFSELESLLTDMLDFGLSRKDCVVAVGGGVVGDLAGLAASCYMRGIDFYNIPTTLLAQVDSSVGGKTAINFCRVKNAIGTFYQPKKVLIDPDTLKTLDTRQLHAGLAESIKMALCYDADLFELIERGELEENIPEIIRRSLNIKIKVVELDPTEQGLRRVLNFGHTLGHAIESAADGKMLHGECVALGMIPLCSESVRRRLMPVLEKYSLPVRCTFDAETLLPYLKHDKKTDEDYVNLTLVDEIGSFRFEKLKIQEILSLLEAVQ